MALTFVNKLAAGDNTNLLTYATASWTPTDGRLYLFSFEARIGSGGVNPSVSSISGNGQTWAQVASAAADGAGATDRSTIFLYRCVASGSSTGSISVTLAGATAMQGASWILDEVDGFDDTGGSNGSAAVVQSATSANVSTATPLATLVNNFGDATNNAAYGCFGSAISNNMTGAVGTAGTGFTKTGEAPATNGDFVAILAEYQIGQDLTVDCTFPASGRTGAIAAEIKAASAAAPVSAPPRHPAYRLLPLLGR